MTDAVVELEFLLQNLHQLLLYHADLISGVKNKVERLTNDLVFLKAFLRDSSNKQRKDERHRVLEQRIRDVVYEAEDIIDTFVLQAAERKSKNYLLRASMSNNYLLRASMTPVRLLGTAAEVEIICDKVRDICDSVPTFDFANLGVGDGRQEEPEVPLVRQEIVVGFEDEAETLLRYLTEETQQLDIISIVGMSGLGKTTLAGKIFHDPNIQYEFPTRIWVNVSQEFTQKHVFLSILREFTRLTEDIYSRTDQELAHLIASHLDKGRFLIVMDDVWTHEDWDKLQIALPKSNRFGKVLITSCSMDVGAHVNRSRYPLLLRFMTPDESWLLLQLEVFGKPECPVELEVIGKRIANQCQGLPLKLVLLGGILVKKSSTAKRTAWEKVCESVSSYLNEGPEERFKKIISLSYYKLPFHLRACFLYFGMFPQNCEIPVWKLIQMWIAEGFILQKTSMSLEETAENYLEDLISRKLVKIEKHKADGKVKTCSIHDMLRDFCKSEAANGRENFLQEIKKSSEEFFIPPMSELPKYRRLCIHSNISNFFSSKPYGPHVRSFVCFSAEDVNLMAENYSSIPAGFKLLRVLDVKPMKFTKIPSALYKLVHLRYIVLSFNIAVLPAAFSNLWNIQTLIVYTSSRFLHIKANIWRMFQLRCLKTNVSATLPMMDKSIDRTGKGGEMLQTLGTISPENCTDEVFGMASNLKKLGIRGRLSFMLDGKAGSFDSLARLINLEKLKLLNDVFPSPSSEGKLHRLPEAYKFPPELRSLTLADTFLEWSHMSILGLLKNLKVLKLKDKAFMGKIWEVAGGGFRKLEVLNIGHTDLAVWVATGVHFPSLKQLELQNCEELREVPIGLADIPSLKLLKVHGSKFAASSCKKIFEVKLKMEEKTGKVNMLKLSIFPPDE